MLKEELKVVLLLAFSFRLPCKGLVLSATFFYIYYFQHSFTQYNHTTFIHPSPFAEPSLLRSARVNLMRGAEPRIEVWPALQQADWTTLHPTSPYSRSTLPKGAEHSLETSPYLISRMSEEGGSVKRGIEFYFIVIVPNHLLNRIQRRPLGCLLLTWPCICKGLDGEGRWAIHESCKMLELFL
jgi:hypothetical protein